MADPRDPYLEAIGRLIAATDPWENEWYDLLDAVADLLTAHCRTRHRAYQDKWAAYTLRAYQVIHGRLRLTDETEPI